MNSTKYLIAVGVLSLTLGAWIVAEQIKTTAYIDSIGLIGLQPTKTASETLKVSTEGLVTHWKLDENKGKNLADFSGMNNAGETVNNPVWAEGKFGRALSFDGLNDYAAGSDLDFASGPFTISVWFKTSAEKSMALIHKFENVTNQNYYIFLNDEGAPGSLMAGLYDGTDYREVLTRGEFNDNAWHHVAMVVNKETVRFYVDGINKGRAVHDNSFPTNNKRFNLGRQNGGSAYFKGLIDDLRIYSRTLTSQEISSIYNMAGEKPLVSPTPSPSLISPPEPVLPPVFFPEPTPEPISSPVPQPIPTQTPIPNPTPTPGSTPVFPPSINRKPVGFLDGVKTDGTVLAGRTIRMIFPNRLTRIYILTKTQVF